MLTLIEIENWVALNIELKLLKKREMEIRKTIASSVFGDVISGTVSYTLDDVSVIASVSERLSVAREDLLVLQQAFTSEESECIDWKPSINKLKYDALPIDSIMRNIVVLKLSAPTIKVEGL